MEPEETQNKQKNEVQTSVENQNFDGVSVSQDMKIPKEKSPVVFVVAFIILLLIIVGSLIYKFYPGLFGIAGNYDSELINKEIQTAETMITSGDYDSAIQSTSNLLENKLSIEDQRDVIIAYVSAILRKGSIEFDEDAQSEKAITLLESLLEKYPEDSDGWRLYAYANEIIEKYEIAIEAYDKSIYFYGDSKNSAVSYAGRGHVYDLMGDKEKSLSDYNQALSIDDNLDMAYLGRARNYVFNGDLDLAVKDLEKLFEVASDSRIFAEALQVFGTISLIEGDYDIAESHFEKALESDSKFTQAMVGIAKAKLHKILFEVVDFSNEEDELNYINEILSYLKSALEINKFQTTAYITMADVYTYYYSDYEKSIEIYENILNNDIIEGDITLGKSEKELFNSIVIAELDRINKQGENDL